MACYVSLTWCHFEGAQRSKVETCTPKPNWAHHLCTGSSMTSQDLEGNSWQKCNELCSGRLGHPLFICRFIVCVGKISKFPTPLPWQPLTNEIFICTTLTLALIYWDVPLVILLVYWFIHNTRPSSTQLGQESLVPRLWEKWPGNFREFKLLLPLPESWQYQSNFRT